MSEQSVLSAILACPVSYPTAREEGAEYVGAWIQQFAERDSRWEIVGSELPWYLWLDDDTLLIGVIDLLARDEQGMFECEWKTTRGEIPARGKFRGFNEDIWLEELLYGPQLPTYALAFWLGATYIGLGKVPACQSDMPRIKVRAVTKERPPQFWPGDDSKSMFAFPPAVLHSHRNALLNKASSIRIQRESGRVPYAVPGIHCTNKFGRLCEFYGICSERKHPPAQPAKVFSAQDPAIVAIPEGLTGYPKERIMRELVIFSASSFADALWCDERYRIRTGHETGEKEESEALDVGTVVHAGLAAFYRGLKRDAAPVDTSRDAVL